MFDSRKMPRGFFALVTVSILSLTLLIAVVTLGQYGISGRLALLDLENKMKSEGYAEACISTARIKLVNDPSYNPSNERVPVGGGDCTIVGVSGGVIHASSTVSGATTNLVVSVTPTTGVIGYWKEIQKF